MSKLYYAVFLVASCLIFSCKKEDGTVVTPPNPTGIKPSIPTGWKALEDYAGSYTVAGVAITINSKMYAGLGYNAEAGYQTVSNQWFEYDPTSNKWTKKNNFPGLGRANAIAFSIDGKAYVGLGTNYNRINKEDLYKDFYEYDPAADIWTKKADFVGTPRDQPVYFTINEKGYFGTGNTPASVSVNTVDFWEYDPKADKWMQKANFIGNARCRAFGFSIQGKGYMGGGEDNAINKLTDFYEYDVATNTWTKKADAPFKSARSKGFSIADKGYIMGGLVGATGAEASINEVQRYDPQTNTWTKFGEIATHNDSHKGRFYQLISAIGSKVYVGAGGYGEGGNPINKKDFYEYVPQ